MVKSNFDDKYKAVQKKGLLAKIGADGVSRFKAYAVAILIGSFLFSSCFVSRSKALIDKSEDKATTIAKIVVTKISTSGGLSQSNKKLNGYMKLLIDEYPLMYRVKVFRGSTVIASSDKNMKVDFKEASYLKKLKKIHDKGKVLEYVDSSQHTVDMKGYFIVFAKQGGQYLSLSLLFKDATTINILAPYLIVLLIVILVSFVFFLWKMSVNGSEVMDALLRYFVIFAILAMLLGAHFILVANGNSSSVSSVKFADKNAAFMVKNNLAYDGAYGYKELVKQFNKDLDGRVENLYKVSEKDSKVFIEGADGVSGGMGGLTFIFLLISGSIILPIVFGSYGISYNKLEGVKTFLSYMFLVIFIFISMLPILWIIMASFFSKYDITSMATIINSGQIFTKNFFTMANYGELLSGNFLVYFRNSLFVSAVTAIVCGFFGIVAGYAFSRFHFPGRDKQLIGILTSQLFPMAMMILPLYIVAQFLHIEQSLLIIILAYSATALPFSIWMMKGYYDTIPIDIEEAAAIDGASTIARLWHILLPVVRPAIATTVFFSFITSWNEFVIASFFLNQDKLRTLPVAVRAMLNSSNYAGFSAAGVLASLPVVLLFIYLQKHLVSGLMAGGVKQ